MDHIKKCETGHFCQRKADNEWSVPNYDSEDDDINFNPDFVFLDKIKLQSASTRAIKQQFLDAMDNKDEHIRHSAMLDFVKITLFKSNIRCNFKFQ